MNLAKFSNEKRVVYAIIGLNVGVFAFWNESKSNRRLFQIMVKNFTISHYGVFNQGNYHTAITSCFSHRDPFHLLSNMVTLFFFGQEVSALLGWRRFLALYIVGGTISSMGQITWPYFLPQSWTRTRFSRYDHALGASGAVNAVVAYAICAYPRQTIMLYFVLPVPAALFGVAYILKDVYGLYMGTSHIGHAAHLSGALTGFLYFIVRRYRFRIR
jgi:membrane associated rhomboid family serine protease